MYLFVTSSLPAGIAVHAGSMATRLGQEEEVGRLRERISEVYFSAFIVSSIAFSTSS